MQRERRGGWVYIMTERYRGTFYVGSTADLAARIFLHRQGQGSEFCAEHGLTRLVWMTFLPSMKEAMDHEKRVKRWHRDWKIALVEEANPDWRDLYDDVLA